MVPKRRPTAAYQIRVQSRLDASWSDWFDGMTLTRERDVTTLSGAVPDQAAAQGSLDRVWGLNLVLISVARIEEDPQCKIRHVR